MSEPATPLIYNPSASGGRGLKLAQHAVGLLAARGIDAAPEPTTGPGGASPLAERLARGGARRLFALGGDGTLSETADGVLRSGASVELGFIPGGTGNDFLLGFGVGDAEEAVRRIVAGSPRALDAGRVRWAGGERFFIGVFGTGFMAKVADLANRRLKRFGAKGYTLAVFPELAYLRAPTTRLVMDERVVEEPLVLVAVCNTRHMGGAMEVAPMAQADDGVFEVVALRKVGRVALLRIFPKIFSGSHVGHERVLLGRAKHVRIEPLEPSPLLGDGEIYGSTPVDIDIMPGALRVLL